MPGPTKSLFSATTSLFIILPDNTVTTAKAYHRSLSNQLWKGERELYPLGVSETTGLQAKVKQ